MCPKIAATATARLQTKEYHACNRKLKYLKLVESKRPFLKPSGFELQVAGFFDNEAC